MQLIQGTTEFELAQPSAVSIGKFDGIHRGHKQLLDRIIRRKADGMQAVVFTFDPPPTVFFGKDPVRSVTTQMEKRRIFERIGIDVLIEFPLTADTAAMSPEKFVESVLVGRMHTSYVAAGTDVSFGAGGRGDYALLASLGKRYGFAVEIRDKICVDGREISSSFVREELEKGNMERVAELIGAPYSITGTVVHGRRLGRTLGMPTVNLIPEADKLLPPKGVYYSQVSYRGNHYRSISNIGCKPTVSNENVMGVETYLYDFEEDIYGKDIIVNLFSFKRPEMKFASLEELKHQMQKDIAEGAKWGL
ncbi:MAG: bifunctional riboflavin kinase/FAD synthetase [Lachnospiraceae bacterium]